MVSHLLAMFGGHWFINASGDKVFNLLRDLTKSRD